MEGITDIFDVGDKNSLVREMLMNHNPINLSDHTMSIYKIPESHNVTQFKFGPSSYREYKEQIEKVVNPIIDNAKKLGYPENLFVVLYEAVINAFQHGNKMNPNKNVVLASKLDDKSAEFAIIDEGERLIQSL